MLYDATKKKKRPLYHYYRYIIGALVVVLLVSVIAFYALSSLQKPHYLALITRSKTYLIDAQGALHLELQCQQFVWSPDGLHFLCINGNHVEIIDAAGENSVRITLSDYISFSHAPWSPDSKQLVFTQDYKIYLMNSDGTDITPVAIDYPTQWEHPAMSSPSWSPGGRIAFTSNLDTRDTGVDIYSMNQDGTGVQRIAKTNPWTPVLYTNHLSWSPDNLSILFLTYNTLATSSFGNSGDTGQLNMINADGTQHTLIDSVATSQVFPVWSSDSTRIAYSDNSQIYVYHIETGETVTIGEGENPLWAGDSYALVFVRDGQVYFADVDTLEVWQPFVTNYDVKTLAWQP